MKPPKAAKTYTDTHWGIPPSKVYEVDDPDLPDALTMMGHLIEVKVDQGGGTDLAIEFPRGSLLAFDPDPPRRLYIVLTDSTCRLCKANLLDGAQGASWYRMADVARSIGGRQKAPKKLAALPVQIVGIAVSLVYKTEKEGDGVSLYEHELGEESGIQPALCIDETGRLWLVGGNYAIEDRGIVD